MSALAEDTANILSAVVAQLRTLSDDEVKALVTGEAEFRLVPKKARRPAAASAPAPSAKPTVDKPTAEKTTVDKNTPDKTTVDKPAEPGLNTDEVRAGLAACATEPDAVAYLQGLKMSVAMAKGLATGLGLRLPARPSVAAIITEIVRVLVRGRLNAATVQRL